MAEPGRTMWVGQRDHALLLLALQTETNLISLRCKDVVLGAGAHIRCSTTGDRKAALPSPRNGKAGPGWIGQRPDSDTPFFSSIGVSAGGALEYLVRKHCLTASRTCPSLAGNPSHCTPYDIARRWNCSLHGVDQSVIALWLGHESVETK